MAKGAIEVTVDIHDLRALSRLLRDAGEAKGFVAEPWRQGMTELASLGGIAAQRGAPVLTGKLQGSIRARVSKHPFPRWVAIRVSARSSKRRYPYPRLLAFSSKHHHKDWLIRAVLPVWQGADRALERIGAAIARKWERGE